MEIISDILQMLSPFLKIVSGLENLNLSLEVEVENWKILLRVVVTIREMLVNVNLPMFMVLMLENQQTITHI